MTSIKETQKFIDVILADMNDTTSKKTDTLKAYETGYLKGLKHMASMVGYRNKFTWNVRERVH